MIKNLNDVPWQYRDNSDEVVHDWHNDPNHNVEPTQKLESDKRVERFFISPQGGVWIVWHITDIPESADNPDYAHITEKSPKTGNSWGFVAKDGMVTVVTAHLHLTHDRAMDAIREDVTNMANYARISDETFHSHVYELSQM